ncbi:MAG: CarboxypepD reg-like domain [Planctomycetota bacterium]
MTTPAPTPARVARRRTAAPTARRRIPLAVWAVLVTIVGYWVVTSWQSYQATFAKLSVVRSPETAAVPLQLTFFPDRLAFTAPSPPDPLGTAELPANGWHEFGGHLVPGTALVRYSGKGVGTGFVFVEAGRMATVSIEQPTALWGRVVAPRPYFWFGWRTMLAPVADAEVIAMGGGEHGIPLASARTDADGNFEVDGVAAKCSPLVLRVRAPGFAITHAPFDRAINTSVGHTITLQAAPVRRGRIDAPPGTDFTALRVLARGLPGVDCRPAGGGEFAIEHIAEEFEPELLVHGLPESLAQVRSTAWRGRDSEIRLVAAGSIEGVVRSARDGSPLPGTYVWFGDGATVRADGAGRFTLQQLVPGTATLTAQHVYQPKNRKPIVRVGSLEVTVTPGAPVRDIVIEVP